MVVFLRTINPLDGRFVRLYHEKNVDLSVLGPTYVMGQKRKSRTGMT